GTQENRVIPLMHEQCADTYGAGVFQGFGQQLIGLFSTVLGDAKIGRVKEKRIDFIEFCKRHDLQIARRSGSKLLDFLVLHKNILSFVKFVALDDFISPYKAVAVRAKKRLAYPCVALFVDLVEICALAAR